MSEKLLSQALRLRDFFQRLPTRTDRSPCRPELDREKRASAIALVQGGLSPTRAARQLGIGRFTLYRELALGGIKPNSENSDAVFDKERIHFDGWHPSLRNLVIENGIEARCVDSFFEPVREIFERGYGDAVGDSLGQGPEPPGQHIGQPSGLSG